MSSELDHCVGQALALTLASCFVGEASEIFHQSSSGAALDVTAELESETDRITTIIHFYSDLYSRPFQSSFINKKITVNVAKFNYEMTKFSSKAALQKTN